MTIRATVEPELQERARLALQRALGSYDRNREFGGELASRLWMFCQRRQAGEMR